MLHWSDEPIRYRPGSEYPTQEEWDNLPMFCLRDELDDRLESLKDAYAEARSDGMSARIVEQKQTAIKEFQNTIILARTYLCAIDDELAKGNSSALRLNPKASNAAYEYITLTSLKEWALQKFNLQILPDILTIDAAQASKIVPRGKSPPRLIMRNQEDVILEEIVRLNCDPKAIPKNPRRGPGIKANVRLSLNSNPLFAGSTVFDDAWERLRGQKRITDME